MKTKIKNLIISIAIPLIVGGIVALIIKNDVGIYKELPQPFFAPPSWAFPIIWTVLYILMGIASYLIFTSSASKQDKSNALTVYGIQLFVNALWSIFFFQNKWYLFSFVWLIFLWILIICTMKVFYPISKKATYLLIPYFIWVTIAAYLNWFVYINMI